MDRVLARRRIQGRADGNTLTMTVRVGIIGTSDIAGAHAQRFRCLAGVRLGTVCSRSLERARRFASQHQFAAHTDHPKAIFEDPDIDAVVIATEPERHLDLAIGALAAQKHILIEKPIDKSLDKAERFRSRIERYPRVISVVSQKRFDPILKTMKERLDEGEGAAKLINLGLMWRRDEAYYHGGGGWRRTDSNFFFNQGIHWLDILNWFFGYPVQVHAFSLAGRPEVASRDRCVGILRYGDGTLASLYGASFGDRSQADRFFIHRKDDVLDYQGLRESMADRGPFSWFHRRMPSVPAEDTDLLSLQSRDFIDAIHRGRPPVTTVANAMAALRLAVALNESSESGGGDHR